MLHAESQGHIICGYGEEEGYFTIYGRSGHLHKQTFFLPSHRGYNWYETKLKSVQWFQ